jgi:hypothetical protein
MSQLVNQVWCTDDSQSMATGSRNLEETVRFGEFPITVDDHSGSMDKVLVMLVEDRHWVDAIDQVYIFLHFGSGYHRGQISDGRRDVKR